MSKVLVVIDAQVDFINGVLGTKEAQEAMPYLVELIKEMKDKNYKLFATRDSHFNKGGQHLAYEDSLEGQKLPVPHCIVNTEGWHLHPDIVNLLDKAIIVNKPTFGSYDLIRWLEAENTLSPITEIVIAGFCTDICVISNALMIRAAFKDIPIFIKEKACAGVTPESHQKAIDVMKMCQIDIV